MATLNHAKDNRQGAGSPKQYETNGLRGRILVFRFLEPRSTRLSLSPPHTRSPSYFYSTSSSSHPPLDVIFLSHIPSCAFIIFKRGWRIFSSSFSSLLRFSVFNFLYPTPSHLHPTSSSFLSLVLPLFTPDAKRKESLREPGNT